MMLIAFKMLINSRKKFIGMLIGATFSAFILMQQPGTYQGVSDRLVSEIHALKDTDLWVMGQASSEFDQPTYFNAMDIYRIRSIPGVESAVQLYKSWYTMTHLKTNKTMGWRLIGVDPATLKGLPKEMIAGDRASIYQSNAIIIDGYSVKQFETSAKETLELGDKMIEGQRTWVITGMTKPLRTYAYQPKVYILSNHIPGIIHQPSFILVKVRPEFAAEEVAREIHRVTGYDALTPLAFVTRALQFFRVKTPIIIIFVCVAILGFTIGLIIMWQIFSNFILTHAHQFGMLKMLGTSNAILIKMVLFQAAVTGGIGYLIGLILTMVFGLIFNDTTVAFHLTWEIALLGSFGTMLIIALASYVSILQVLRFDTVDLCRDLN